MSNLQYPTHGEWWLETPAGRYLARWSHAISTSLLMDVFGLQATQIGCETLDLIASNRIQHRFRCNTAHDHPPLVASNSATPIAVTIEATNLPFASDSLDLVVLPFMLEAHADPHQVLREAYRVLRPEGRLLILGLNPLSFWGLRNTMSHFTQTTQLGFPWPGHYLSVHRLKDWLKLLGFEVARGHFGCYAPPCRYDRTMTHLHWLELAGNRWWAFAGGAYALVAIKRVTCLTLVTPPWNTSSKLPHSPRALVTEIHHTTPP